MKRTPNAMIGNIFFLSMVLWVTCPSVSAQDMRKLQTEARLSQESLMQKAAAEKAQADREAAETRQRITEDRKSLEKAVSDLSLATDRKRRESEDLKNGFSRLAEQESHIDRDIAQTDAMMKELVGVIRVNAKDVDALIGQNPQAALAPPSASLLSEVADETRFPGMTDVRHMADVLENLVTTAGEVTQQKGPIVDRAGRQTEAEILMLGPFTAAYRNATEIGFLDYIGADRRLYALSRLPSTRVGKQLARYMDGREEAVPIDISRGGALRQLVQHITFWQQVPQGGPIGWIIVALFGAGVIIVIERFIFFQRRRIDGELLIHRIDTLAAENNWAACKEVCTNHIGKPLARVMMAGLNSIHLKREELEDVLQEAILKEIPSLEQFLSTLGMLATIAPLLGLLGTVTGMINTFHVITQHGAADPRMMSSGISEALVTTMLGLIAAIPFLFVHTLLSRKADTTITQMEEKAVALVNIVHEASRRDD